MERIEERTATRREERGRVLSQPSGSGVLIGGEAATFNGTWADGEELVLFRETGSAWGSRTDRPRLFDNIDFVYNDSAVQSTPYASVGNGQSVPVGGSNVWQSYSPNNTQNPIISTTQPRGIRSKAYNFRDNSAFLGMPALANAASQNFYVSVWIRHNGVNDWKTIRFFGIASGKGKEIVASNNFYSANSMPFSDGCSRQFTCSGFSTLQGPANTWYLLEVMFSALENTGRAWRDGGAFKPSFSGCSPNCLYAIASPDSTGYIFDETGFDPTSTQVGGNVWFSSMYVDTEANRKRVEITDSATWSRTGNREIQFPLDWSDSEITVAIGSGQWLSLSGRHVHLIAEAFSGSADNPTLATRYLGQIP